MALAKIILHDSARFGKTESQNDFGGGNTKMSFYPAPINKRFLEPKNAGTIENAIAAKNGSFVCGAVLELSFKIENDCVLAAKFRVAGCGFLMAAADVLCEKLVGRKINENLNVFELIQNELGEFAPERQHCLDLTRQTWQAMVNNFRAQQAKNGWNGDDALVCSCFGVSEKTIETAIENHSLTTVEEVTQRCRAGGGCGSCQPIIQEILDAHDQFAADGSGFDF